MAKRKDRVDTSGGDEALGGNQFGALDGLDVPASPEASVSPKGSTPKPKKRGRVDVKRVKSGKGGKTVTELSGFTKISPPELEDLARELRKKCGVGGTYRGGVIEIQGDQREKLCALLEEKGFRPVLAGG